MSTPGPPKDGSFRLVANVPPTERKPSARIATAAVVIGLASVTLCAASLVALEFRRLSFVASGIVSFCGLLNALVCARVLRRYNAEPA